VCTYKQVIIVNLLEKALLYGSRILGTLLESFSLLKRAGFFNYVSFWFFQNKKDMNEMMKHMEENIEKVRRENKTILYAIVGLLSRKMYIGIKFPQIYIIRDT
jgi:hypothetical protein